MVDKGKSSIEQALQSFFALRAIEEWQLEAQRAEIERREAIMKRRQTSNWSTFVSYVADDYAGVRDLCQIELLSFGEIDPVFL